MIKVWVFVLTFSPRARSSHYAVLKYHCQQTITILGQTEYRIRLISNVRVNLSENDERFMKIEELTPQTRSINLTVKVISINPVRDVTSQRDGSSHRVTEALVADETGSVLLTLWDDTIDEVSEGDIYDVRNGYIRLFRGSMQLNTGRYGSLTPSDEVIDETNEENNMSDRQYEEEQRSYGGGRGYGGQRRQSYPRRNDRDRRY